MYNVIANCQVKGLADIYQKYFGDDFDGTFLDAGAFEGYEYSNTGCLAELGWKGLFIEPVPYNFFRLSERYKSYFPDIRLAYCAVGKQGEADLYLSGSISTLSKEQHQYYLDHEWMYGNEQVIHTITVPLDQIIDQWKPEKIDVLNVDVEGMELEVLETFDIDKWMPKMAIIEAHEHHPFIEFRRNAENINKYFSKRNYEKIYSDELNNIYVR
jgi:FkbM family methyltransferase